MSHTKVSQDRVAQHNEHHPVLACCIDLFWCTFVHKRSVAAQIYVINRRRSMQQSAAYIELRTLDISRHAQHHLLLRPTCAVMECGSNGQRKTMPFVVALPAQKASPILLNITGHLHQHKQERVQLAPRSVQTGLSAAPQGTALYLDTGPKYKRFSIRGTNKLTSRIISPASSYFPDRHSSEDRANLVECQSSVASVIILSSTPGSRFLKRPSGDVLVGTVSVRDHLYTSCWPSFRQ